MTDSRAGVREVGGRLRFLADMGVSGAVTEWLKRSGHDVRHLRDEGLQQLHNGEVFLKVLSRRGPC